MLPSMSTPRVYLSTLGDTVPSDTGTSHPEEVGTLLRLLRRALEGATGVLPEAPEMAEVGRLLLARCDVTQALAG